jgi:AcrR family transcriptional regulator
MNDALPLPNKRPGGRSAQVQALVRTALEELVAEQGRERVTVPAVAERAGVSASSIYRRWGDLQGLLAETATHRLDPNRPLPNSGALRVDLEAWARELIDAPGQPCNTSLLKAAAALATGDAGHRLPAQPPQGSADAGGASPPAGSRRQRRSR